MGRGMAGQSFQAERRVQQITDLRIGIGQFIQLGFLLNSFLQRHFQIVRYQLGDPVHITVSQVQCASHVPYDRLGPHGSKGDDLANPVTTILFDHILDHFAPAVLAEVHVDIRHGDTFRIKETFKQKVIWERVKICNFDCIRNQRTGRRAPARADRNTSILGPADKVGYDQKVGRKFHITDAVQLDRQTVKIGLLLFQRHIRILGQDRDHAFLESLRGQIFQHIVVILSCGRVKMREIIGFAVHRKLQIALIGNHQSIADRLWSV